MRGSGMRTGPMAALVGFMMLAAACGGGGTVTESSSTTVRATTTTPKAPTTSTTTTVVETLAVTSLEGVQTAVLRIVAEGSFVGPDEGLQFNVAGSGSGFIIDQSGLAVTNNHVVTGAALLDVYVNGESEPRNARILGVSECSDLAVIDLEGEGYPYLEWHEGALSVGLDVYTAGFPLGDPEFTLTKGIISKASADGESSWASVDSVLEHDATINPGNSGGPLVTADGRVVGINYAAVSDTNQYFAISRDEAVPIIDILKTGEDVTSLGINGQAFDIDGISGVWVSSIDSGSPADLTGIEPGDMITALEGLILATDGTMADYCDVLRTNGPDEVLSVEVLRSSTEEFLEGRINDSPLELSFSFRQELGDDVAQGGVDEYLEYVQVTDDTGVIVVDVPTDWFDLDGEPREDFGPSIVAATSVEGYFTTWDTPGVEVAATREFDGSQLDELMDILIEDADCFVFDREEYQDVLYTGLYQVLDLCGGTDTAVIFVVATPESADFVIIVVVQVVTDADLAAVDRILATFEVIGDF